MGLDIYNNKDEIVDNITPIRGQTLTDNQLTIIEPVPVWNKIVSNKQLNTTDGPFDPYILEFHLYTANGDWITGNYDAESAVVATTPSVPPVQNQYQIAASIAAQQLYQAMHGAYDDATISFDVRQLFDTLKIERGQYKFVLNYFRNRIGSYENRPLFVKEISPDRREVKLNFRDFQGIQTAYDQWTDGQAPYTDAASIYEDYENFARWQVQYTYGHPSPISDDDEFYDLDTRYKAGGKVNNPASPGTAPYSPPAAWTAGRGIINGADNSNISSFIYLALNFGENKVYRTINWWIDYNDGNVNNNDIHVRLHSPLPNDIEESCA